MYKTERVKIRGSVATLSHEPQDGVVWDVSVISATGAPYHLSNRPKIIKNQAHLCDSNGIHDLQFNGFFIDLVYATKE